MKKLGISVYPEKSDLQQLKDYIGLAASKGFSRIFSCLLSAEGETSEIIKKFKEINQYAKLKGFEIILDVAPNVFSKFDISCTDLEFFHNIFADGLRLDLGYTGYEEAMMTYNDYGLKIELNMSNYTHYIDTIMDYCPNKHQLMGCHNFYPHRYFGLQPDYFIKCTEAFLKYGLRTAAFITTQQEGAFGPWPFKEGLPTLEMHRNMPIDIQLKHYIAMGTIDDVIISNCYASAEEFEKLANLRKDMVTFDIIFSKAVPETERKLVLEEKHVNRGDVNGYAIRSVQGRLKYKDTTFSKFNVLDNIEIGDVLIESSGYGRYAGELQIATKAMKNSGNTNVVGKIAKEELFLLDYIKPWQKFMFAERV